MVCDSPEAIIYACGIELVRPFQGFQLGRAFLDNCERRLGGRKEGKSSPRRTAAVSTTYTLPDSLTNRKGKIL